MSSLVQSQSFDGDRGQAQQNLYASPAGSPRVSRPPSQASIHVPQQPSYSPHLPAESPMPVSAYPTYRPFADGLTLPPIPMNGTGVYPNSAPMTYFPAIFDGRSSQPMIRTVSHAHPMNSASEQTVSSRYSSSPHSANGQLVDAPPTAGAPSGPWGQPSFSLPDDARLNPMFASNGYSMSRSTSGNSEGPETRLLTPHMDYRTNPAEAELRQVDDSLAGKKYYPQLASFTPRFDLQNHALGLGPHPQPDAFFGNKSYGAGSGAAFSLAEQRGGESEPVGETEYERERREQIMNNKKLLDDVGLGSSLSFGSKHVSGGSSGTSTPKRKASTPVKKRLHLEGSREYQMRASPRIRSMNRSISYANLDGGSGSDDDYGSSEHEQEQDDEEEEFRPTKRSRGGNGYRQKSASYSSNTSSKAAKPQLSLWGLLQVYSSIPHNFPLFYYTLNNDLTINSDSVPLIGSIPSNCTPIAKAETLAAFFHRGRRVLAQLDAFTTRCDRKYEGPENKWPELDYHTRIAVRDVRRKIVERCENYKYTRRDILDKHVGRGKWKPIEDGMIEWRVGMTVNDPANDLANVTLTLPTPPPDAYAQSMRQTAPPPIYTDRAIKPYPHGRRIASAAPRNVSVVMGEPDEHANPSAAGSSAMYGYAAPPAKMYGEDQVPLSVQMPGSASSAAARADSLEETANAAGWNRGAKRGRSSSEGSDAYSAESEE
ncbi:hypothetical protein L202_01270 [Cryptococcus amylolentus CBS 6039]|uniref:Uncharacterized protein n=1 Tax=Cryptococcus amylolentus CBS 6039 TaxID=1295533 RepID=A0A1E3I356_9TREE|nr:hypothetical protein L202_01270 [Cryptococcus amylolentus CBS 6039]ODN83044.1 hypothetical protein L202_01270 [Cryptococcus amylolentus CBS 6039]